MALRSSTRFFAAANSFLTAASSGCNDVRHRATVQRLGLVGVGQLLGHLYLVRVAVEIERAGRVLDDGLGGSGTSDFERGEARVEQEREPQVGVLRFEVAVPFGQVEVQVSVQV